MKKAGDETDRRRWSKKSMEYIRHTNCNRSMREDEWMAEEEGREMEEGIKVDGA